MSETASNRSGNKPGFFLCLANEFTSSEMKSIYLNSLKLSFAIFNCVIGFSWLPVVLDVAYQPALEYEETTVCADSPMIVYFAHFSGIFSILGFAIWLMSSVCGRACSTMTDPMIVTAGKKRKSSSARSSCQTCSENRSETTPLLPPEKPVSDRRKQCHKKFLSIVYSIFLTVTVIWTIVGYALTIPLLTKYNFFEFDPKGEMCNGTLFAYAVLVTVACNLFLVLVLFGFVTYAIQAKWFPKVSRIFKSPYGAIGEENA